MIDLFMAAENLPFSIALTVMFLLALIEGAGVVVGVGLSKVVDAMIPSIDLDGPKLPNVQEAGAVSKLLAWLRVGEVPFLIVLMVFLTAFALTGFALQGLVSGLFGGYLPPLLATPPALLLALPVVRVGSAALAAIMPRDETEAVSRASFVGRVAVITLGEARRGSPSQAKLKDVHGYTHYVMVEPDEEGEAFGPGTSVLLVSHDGVWFQAIRVNNAALVD